MGKWTPPGPLAYGQTVTWWQMTRETCFSCWPKKSKTNTKQYPVSSCLEYWRNIVLYIPVTLCNLILSKAHSVSSFPYRQLTELYINTVVRRVQVHLLLHTCDCLYRIKHFVSLDHSECALFFSLQWVKTYGKMGHRERPPLSSIFS